MPQATKGLKTDKGLPEALRRFLADILKTGQFQAVLAPRHLAATGTIMPTLIADPEELEGVDLLSPAFPLNAAKVLSNLTRRPSGERIAAVLRPCEIRAFVELVKLNQGRREDVLLISVDCLGAFDNRSYAGISGENQQDFSLAYCRQVLAGKGTTINGVDIAEACAACGFPVSESADITIGLLGVKFEDHLLVEARTDEGGALLQTLELSPASAEPEREAAIEHLCEERRQHRDAMISATEEKTSSLEKLNRYLATCVNCYNCRVACPVCYCKECVFSTEVFQHEPSQYLRWAARKRAVKMPVDTVFYHITRMVHMSTACVGCGQCSNACPNDIPVMELFQMVAARTQKAFDYEAGRDVAENPPLSVFRESEYEEVVGI